MLASSLNLAVACIGAVGFGFYGSYSVKVGILTMELGGAKRTGLVSGFVVIFAQMAGVMVMAVSAELADDKSVTKYTKLFYMNLVVCLGCILGGIFIYPKLRGPAELEDEQEAITGEQE